MSHSDILKGLIEYQKEKNTTMIPWTDLSPNQRIAILLSTGQDGKLQHGKFWCGEFSVRVYNRTSYNGTALITVKKSSNDTIKLLQYLPK